jgi:hypothetical protein
MPRKFESVSSKRKRKDYELLCKISNDRIQKKLCSGLYKQIIPKTQMVYYDDLNELVTRLNLLTYSQNAGNTGVNNEIISILEELRENNIILKLILNIM